MCDVSNKTEDHLYEQHALFLQRCPGPFTHCLSLFTITTSYEKQYLSEYSTYLQNYACTTGDQCPL